MPAEAVERRLAATLGADLAGFARRLAFALLAVIVTLNSSALTLASSPTEPPRASAFCCITRSYSTAGQSIRSSLVCAMSAL